MTATPPEGYLVEILQEQPATVVVTGVDSHSIEVEIGNVTVVGEPAVPTIIEVPINAPVGSGIKQIETVPFTRQGTLTVSPSTSEYPIGPGTFSIDSISARVSDSPVGSDVILDVFKNGSTLWPTPADRPTIAPGAHNAVIGAFGLVMLEEGDYLEVTIEQVGSAVAGSNLVVTIRLERIT